MKITWEWWTVCLCHWHSRLWTSLQLTSFTGPYMNNITTHKIAALKRQIMCLTRSKFLNLPPTTFLMMVGVGWVLGQIIVHVSFSFLFFGTHLLLLVTYGKLTSCFATCHSGSSAREPLLQQRSNHGSFGTPAVPQGTSFHPLIVISDQLYMILTCGLYESLWVVASRLMTPSASMSATIYLKNNMIPLRMPKNSCIMVIFGTSFHCKIFSNIFHSSLLLKFDTEVGKRFWNNKK